MKKRIHEKARSFLILLLTLGLQQAIAQPTASISSTTSASCYGTATGSISVSFSHTVSTTFTVELDSSGTRYYTYLYNRFCGILGIIIHLIMCMPILTNVNVKENTTNTTTLSTGVNITQPSGVGFEW